MSCPGRSGGEHALLVRPKDGAYQILSGHHRVEAAKRAGLADVPCWVKDLDDDEAFMQLVLGNTQGELAPLEIGMHALKAVPPAQGKAGGGLKAYAERLGLSGEYIGRLRSAAEVQASLPTSGLEVADKAKHLYEISRAPREAWPFLVDRLLAKGWSVADASSQVEKVRKFDIPDGHAYWLPYASVVEAYLRSDRLNPAAVSKLISAALARILGAVARPAQRLSICDTDLGDTKTPRRWRVSPSPGNLRRKPASRWVYGEGCHGYQPPPRSRPRRRHLRSLPDR